jgi:threonylcarbamoyladenosine tRNA methylthiotransferase MtaB
LVVVNTCAVTAEAARKSSQALRQLRRANPRARLVASGCLVTLETGPGRGGDWADLVVPNRDKDRLVEIAAAALALPGRCAPADPAGSLLDLGRQRAFVKVQDGCRYSCTFCATTLARGEERSRPVAELVDAIGRLADSGVREAVLTGVHLGGYGSDLGGDLGGLIRAILAGTDLSRLRLGSLEPWDLPPGFWGLFADPRLMPHLHLPMQSGSDSVLRRMARRAKTADFARLAGEGRRAVPGLNLTTDILVGFPGESEDDWRQTLQFVEAMGFGQVHAFGFSPRPGTRAAGLPERVDPATRGRRIKGLRALAGRLRRRVLLDQVGGEAELLLERAPATAVPGSRFGYTPNYLPVLVAPDPEIPPLGGLCRVRLLGVAEDGDCLIGERAGPT